MKKQLPLLLCLVLALPVMAFSQKAYETTIYVGNVNKLNVQLSLANGYIGASQIKITDKRKRVVKYNPVMDSTEDGTLKFIRYPAAKSAKDYFVINNMQESYEAEPGSFEGKYYHRGKITDILLIK